MTTHTSTLSPASADLFADLVEDAPNWNGSPILDITKEQRGNLTDLKRKGLVKTMVSDDCEFVIFTAKGIEAAKELGIDLTEIIGS